VRCSFYLDQYVVGRAGMGMKTAKSFLLSPTLDRSRRALAVNCFLAFPCLAVAAWHVEKLACMRGEQELTGR